MLRVLERIFNGAAVPPRREDSESEPLLSDSDVSVVSIAIAPDDERLQLLIEMGVPEDLAMQSLRETGNVGVAEALDHYLALHQGEPSSPGGSHRSYGSALSAGSSAAASSVRSVGSSRASTPSKELFQGLRSSVWVGVKETFFCSVCFENRSLRRSVQLDTCGHRYCRQCLGDYLCSKIKDGALHIRCFVDNCGVEIGTPNIEKLVDSETFKKLCIFRLNYNNPNMRQCSKCNTSIEGSMRNPVIVCPECSHEYCFEHGDAHLGKSCSQFARQELEEERLSKAWIDEKAQKCPGCERPIQKYTGCNHMTCAVCETQFCWTCCSVFPSASEVNDHYSEWNAVSRCRQFDGKQSIWEDDPDEPITLYTRVRNVARVALLLLCVILLLPTLLVYLTLYLLTCRRQETTMYLMALIYLPVFLVVALPLLVLSFPLAALVFHVRGLAAGQYLNTLGITFVVLNLAVAGVVAVGWPWLVLALCGVF